MRVLYLTPTMLQGGAEKALLDLIAALQGQVEAHLVMLYPQKSYPFFFRAEVEALGIPVTFLEKRPGRLGRIPAGWRYWRVLRDFQPQLIHAYQWHAIDAARAFQRVFARWIPLVVNAQNMMTNPQRIAIERRRGHLAACTVAISAAVATQYRAEVPAAKVRVIPNGIDTDYFSPGDRGAARAALGLPPGGALGLFAARWASQKNHHLLIQAVERLVRAGRWQAGWRVLCLGRSDEEPYSSHWRGYIQQAGLGEFILLHDAVHDTAPYYHACDLLLLPSAYEGLGNVVLEAAACGRPALVSAAVQAAIPEVVGWVVPGGDVGALADMLEYALALPPAQRDSLGQTARTIITGRYTRQHMAGAHWALYNELVEAHLA